jgi:hypothetical protein
VANSNLKTKPWAFQTAWWTWLGLFICKFYILCWSSTDWKGNSRWVMRCYKSYHAGSCEILLPVDTPLTSVHWNTKEHYRVWLKLPSKHLTCLGEWSILTQHLSDLD